LKPNPPPSTGLVVAATATSVIAIAQQVMGRATRDALFLSSFPVERLPAMMIAAAAVSFLSAVYVGRLITRLSPARVIPWLFGVSGVLLAAEWALGTVASGVLAIVIYLHWAVFGGTLVSTFWSVINERFDPRAGKRYVGWIASGATAGGIVGGIAAFLAARFIATQDTLAPLSVMHLLCSVLSFRHLRSRAGIHRSGTPAGDTVPSALGVLKKVAYLRDLAVLVATVSAMEALADYTLNAQAAAKWAHGAELMSFFSLFHMVVSVVTFLLQVLVGRLALERLGLVGALATLPLFAMAGSGVAAIAPRLWTAVALRGAMSAIGNSFYRSGYELLFGPLPPEKKRPTKTVIDVAFDRLGTTLGSGFALSMIALLPSLVPVSLLVAVFGLAVFSVLVTRRLQAGYVRLLEESLTVAPALHGRARPELGLSQTFGRMDRAELMKEIASLRRENLLVSGEMTSPFAWFDASEPGTGSSPPPTSSTPPPSAPPLRSDRSEDDDKGRAVSDIDIAPAQFPARLTPTPASLDTLTTRTAALLSGDVARIRAVLEEPSFDPRLAPHAIVLLANETVQRDAVRALRTIANRITGQLTDALLDRAVPPHVRRRVARAMSTCTSQRAVDGLVEGLLDDSFEVRYQCGLTLLKITHTEHNLSVSKEGALSAVRREVDLDRKLWQHQPPLGAVDEEGDLPLVDGFLRDRTSRSLQHVFSILALVFEREPMRRALMALSGDDEILRGTALEYLDEVLPSDVKAALWPYVTSRKGKEKTRPSENASE
jgi:ATP:ADP antiporter, AAA family